MNCSMLIWTPQAVEVVTGSERYTMPVALSFQDRHAARLFSDHAGTLSLRVPADRRPFRISRDGGAGFEPIEAVPGDGGPISAYGCTWHPSTGHFTAVENDVVWIYDGGWRSRRIPEDFTLRSVSVDPRGCIWCAGAIPSTRIPEESTEGAIFYQPSNDAPFQRYPLGLAPAEERRAIEAGGMGEFFRIDASARPLVASSSSSWPFDDPSSFLFLLGDHPFVLKLEEETPCHLDRPSSGVVSAFTMEGGTWRIEGKGVERDSIKSTLMELLGVTEFWQLMVWEVDAHDRDILTVVQIWGLAGGPGTQRIEATALCASHDGGATFHLLERLPANAENGPMILSAVLSN